MGCQFATFRKGVSPIVAVALHSGHFVRPEVRPYLRLDAQQRLREEDAFTGRWTVVADNRALAHHSRFECDLNRPREKALYLKPEDAWGLNVWRHPVPESIVDHSLTRYDRFYQRLYALVESLLKRHPRVVVLDLHSYNHRRGGPESDLAETGDDPDINIGTGSMNRDRWSPIVDRFMADLRAFDFPERPLDVRENVRFLGGEMAKKLHARYPATVCVLAVEVKKFFMDEWTAELYPQRYNAVLRALWSTVPGLLDVLGTLRHGAYRAA